MGPKKGSGRRAPLCVCVCVCVRARACVRACKHARVCLSVCLSVSLSGKGEGRRQGTTGTITRVIPRERKIRGSNPACDGISAGHTSDIKTGTPVVAVPGVRRYRVSAGTG